MKYPSYKVNIDGVNYIGVVTNDTHLENRIVRVSIRNGKPNFKNGIFIYFQVPEKPILEFKLWEKIKHNPTGVLIPLNKKELEENSIDNEKDKGIYYWTVKGCVGRGYCHKETTCKKRDGKTNFAKLGCEEFKHYKQ